MPIYEYRRPDGTTFEIQQSFSDDALSVDPDTGVPVERVLHAPAVHFKGKGFYNTDYGTRNRQRETAAAAEKSSGEKSSGEKSSGEKSSSEKSSGEKSSPGEKSSAEKSTSGEKSSSPSTSEGKSAKGSAKSGDSKPVTSKG
jgi:predicted nucleic acid-binding Zn ribbon protein